ncbi:putative Band 7/SPFH domain superfamily protein [Dioscorea sansibarensis]
MIQLAQTTRRSELGKITPDKTFEERSALNENIVFRVFLSSIYLYDGSPFVELSIYVT